MKAIVSVIGKDKRGIIAHVSAALYKMDVNIEDISQTILQEYFTMIMAVDLDASPLDFDAVKTRLAELGASLGVEINIQLQSIFDSMHRVDTGAHSL